MSEPDPDQILRSNNLRRLFESGEPQKWLSDHSGRWSEADWASLLQHLRETTFWPIDEGELHLHLAAGGWKHLQPQPSASPRRLARAALVYIAGLGVMGLLTGLLTGASSTPVVGLLMPLLFSVIAGTGGFYLASADLKDPKVTQRLALIGGAASVFGLACIGGLACGVVGKLNYMYSYNEYGTSVDNVSAGVEIAALRYKLTLLSTPLGEQRRILGLAEKELAINKSPIWSMSGDLGKQLDALLTGTLEKGKDAFEPVNPIANQPTQWPDVLKLPSTVTSG